MKNEYNFINIDSLDKNIIISDITKDNYINIDCNDFISIKNKKGIDKLIINIFKMNSDKNKINVINYDKKYNYNLNELSFLIKAYKLSDISDRYSYIYDCVCDELDRRFNEFNLCNFKNNLCNCKRCLINRFPKENLIYGCCYTGGRVCPYLKNSKCSIKAISCKLFTCRKLKKEGIKFKPNDFLLIKFFFNRRQKKLIDESLFIDKEEMIKLLIKYKSKGI